MGAEVPHHSISSICSRATCSMLVGATRLASMRRPVRLVGSANVAMSFGCGMSGSGRVSRSKTTVGPLPGGVCARLDGMVSTAHAAMATHATRAKGKEGRTAIHAERPWRPV
jgi:hypothetical protein